MSIFKCNTCHSLDTRKCNGDNEICIECGTPDDFTEVEECPNCGEVYNGIECDACAFDPNWD